jgi:hypothetical protein
MRYGLVIAVVWTLLMGGLGAWAVWHEWQIAYDLLRNEARTHFLKDQAFRF